MNDDDDDDDDDDDEGEEDITHAIFIVDVNEGETKNVTPERTSTRRTKPQKAKTTIKTRRRRRTSPMQT